MTETSPAAAPASFARVLVWDAPTRLFHGLLVACLAGAYATAERDEWQPVHETLGDTTIGLVLFRLFWGFAGTRYARFATALAGPAAMAHHITHLPHGWSRRYAGHSPLSAAFALLFWLLILALGVSGWAAQTAPANAAARLHEGLGHVVLVAMGLYAVALVFSSRRAGENLPLAMVTGTLWGKPGEGIDNARPGVAWLLLAAVAGFWLYRWSSPI
jgi:cytochrome b